MQLARLLHALGLDETRCSHCLAPMPGRGIAALNIPTLRLCPACLAELGLAACSVCRLCGLPLGPEDKTICADCCKQPPPWSGMAYFGPYAGLLRDLILRLKFDGELNLARLLAELLLQASCCLPSPDVIIPIPQHAAGLRRRGFNQVREIGRYLQKLTGLKLNYRLLRRIKAGAPQESLGAQERRENLRNAFLAGSGVSGLRIWLLDDVVTTGSTCRFAAEALLAAGAADVHVLACARTYL